MPKFPPLAGPSKKVSDWLAAFNRICITSEFDAPAKLYCIASTLVIGDAKESLIEIGSLLGSYKADSIWSNNRSSVRDEVLRNIQTRTSEKLDLPSYSQVVKLINEVSSNEDYVLTAAGGLPGELNNNWLTKSKDSFDCEYGYSCMGYEIAGAWGAALAYESSGRAGKVISLVGDGSYLMLNSEILSAVNNGNSIIYILCDNKGFAVIQRLQTSNGSKSFRTMFNDYDLDKPANVDFVAHAKSMGANAKKVTLETLKEEFTSAKNYAGVSVLVIDTHPSKWTEGGAFWEVGVSGSSTEPEIQNAHARQVEGKAKRRL